MNITKSRICDYKFWYLHLAQCGSFVAISVSRFYRDSHGFAGFWRDLSHCVAKISSRRQTSQASESYKNATFLATRKKTSTFPQWKKTFFFRVGQPSTSHKQEGEGGSEMSRLVTTECGLGLRSMTNGYVRKISTWNEYVLHSTNYISLFFCHFFFSYLFIATSINYCHFALQHELVVYL
jgi:hypothetical protein